MNKFLLSIKVLLDHQRISLVPQPIIPTRSTITISKPHNIIVKVPKIQKVFVPKVKKVYVPNKNKIYVRKGSITAPTTVTVQMMGITSLVPIPQRNSYIHTPQGGLPYVQGSIRVSQPQLSYPRISIRVPQPALPYNQGSIHFSQPRLSYTPGSIPVANYAKSTIPKQSITQILPIPPLPSYNQSIIPWSWNK